MVMVLTSHRRAMLLVFFAILCASECFAAQSGQKETTFTSGPTASSNPAFTNSPITFTAVATGNGALRYDWSFGDGTDARNGGSTVEHSYTSPGDYTVKVTATDSLNGTATKSLTITVTPSDTAGISGTAGQMLVSKFSATLDYSTSNKDKAAFSGLLMSVPELFDPNKQHAIVNIAGTAVDFTLGKNGKGANSAGSIQLKLKGKVNKLSGKFEFVGGNVPVKVSVKDSSLTSHWIDDGLDTTVNVMKGVLWLPVFININGTAYTSNVPATYNATAGIGAKFKL